MIKNKGVVLVLLSLLVIPLVVAQNTSNSSSQTSQNTDVISKAYQCLTGQINSKPESSLSLQEAVFGTLALGSNSKLLSAIDSKKIDNNHWEESQSQIKDTAQVLLASNRVGRNTDSIKSWLLSKTISAVDLIWYLQIDIPNREESSCTLSYGTEERTVTISEEMTLTGNPGSCFSISPSGFWLKVNNNCIDNNFSISCSEDFVTSLLYQRSASETIFVSPTAHSSAALGTTQEKINSKCFSTSSGSCDYEGTLWAVLALDETHESVSKYLPYLLALSEANRKYMPNAFLHKITSGTDQYSQLAQLQQQNKYWQAPNTPYNRYYDSALAMLALQGTSALELSNSKNYFQEIVTSEGCWNNNNIRDTGFLLYSAWPRAVPSTGTGPSSQTCSSAGYTCTSLFACNDLEGEILSQYSCSSGVCCSEAPELESCSAQNGVICSSGQTCSGTTAQSTEGSCCLGSCQALPQANECELEGGSCYSSCNNNEVQISASCGDSSSEVCCRPSSGEESSSTLIWIVILAVLILLAVLGIIYRNKLKLLLFRRKSKGSSEPSRGFPPRGSPPFPPQTSFPPVGRPRMIPRQAIKKPVSPQDKEMEETMRKLKEMGS